MQISLLNNVDTLKSTDNATPIELAIMNDDQEFVKLSEYKNISISIGKNGVIYSSVTPEVLEDDKTMSFTLDGNLPFGKYILEVNLIKNDDTVHIVPSRGNFPFTIEKSLNELGEIVTLMSVQELLSSMNDVKTLSEDSNTKVVQAIQTANDAENIANLAIVTANNASSAATSADENATTALSKSNRAISTSNDANEKSDNALSNSNTANSIANDALNKANKAITDSSSAVNTANDAKATADQVRSEFDQIVSGSADAELINSRTNSSGTIYSSLKARLDDSDSQIAQSLIDSKSYTDNKVAELVDTAPETLDTLNELSQALGNDPNFATTISNQIGNKYSKPSNGIPSTDLDADVQGSLNKANTALQTADKATVGLGNVDNTSDLNKPISTATQTALDRKIDKAEKGVANGVATLNADGKVVDSDGNLVEGKVTSVNGKIGDVVVGEIIQQDTAPSDAEEGALWLDTSDNTYQNTIFDEFTNDINDIQSEIGNDSLSTVSQTLKGAVNEVNDSLDEHKAEYAKLLTDVDTLKKLRKERSNKDSNGVFTTVTYKRKSDGTIYAKSVLSGGTAPQYTTRTETFYDVDGTTVLATIPYTLSYDADGDWVGEV